MKKIIKTIFKIIGLLIIAAFLIIAISRVIKNTYNQIKDNKLKKENASYIEEYLRENVSDEIISVEKEKYIPAFLDGGHYEKIEEDDPGAKCNITYTCYSKEWNLKYIIKFSHEEHEKIELIEDEKIAYIRNYNIYYSNYELIESIIKDCGGEATNLSEYNGKEHMYFLLIYTPNTENVKKIENMVHKKVCGKSASEVDETTHFINVPMPRYIFCNDKELYITMANNKNELKDILKDKSYEVRTNLNEKNNKYIELSKIVQKLLGKEVERFKFKENVSQMYNLEKYVSDSKTWIITYELEYGVDYYLNVYIK